MKNISFDHFPMKQFFLPLLLTLASCSTMNVTLTVLEPAQINVPRGIRSLAVVNRSLPAKEEKVKNVLEGVITGEGLFADRAGSFECVRGVADGLVSSPRFTVVVPPENELKGTGTRQFPAPLDWNTVERICRQNQTDALLSLEVFDSNNLYSDRKEQRTRKENDREVKYEVTITHVRSNIESGWRIYDPANRQIIDESIFTDYREWEAEGRSHKEALVNLPPQNEIVKQAGYFAGTQYARRISPSWIHTGREMYKKGNDDMKYAKRLAQTNRWEEAADVWRKYTDDPDSKLAGRACYNMALAAEIAGNLQEAIEWAEKSYVRYNNKKAREYSYILKNRLNRQQRLDEQMGE